MSLVPRGVVEDLGDSDDTYTAGFGRTRHTAHAAHHSTLGSSTHDQRFEETQARRSPSQSSPSHTLPRQRPLPPSPTLSCNAPAFPDQGFTSTVTAPVDREPFEIRFTDPGPALAPPAGGVPPRSSLPASGIGITASSPFSRSATEVATFKNTSSMVVTPMPYERMPRAGIWASSCRSQEGGTVAPEDYQCQLLSNTPAPSPAHHTTLHTPHAHHHSHFSHVLTDHTHLGQHSRELR